MNSASSPNRSGPVTLYFNSFNYSPLSTAPWINTKTYPLVPRISGPCICSGHTGLCWAAALSWHLPWVLLSPSSQLLREASHCSEHHLLSWTGIPSPCSAYLGGINYTVIQVVIWLMSVFSHQTPGTVRAGTTSGFAHLYPPHSAKCLAVVGAQTFFFFFWRRRWLRITGFKQKGMLEVICFLSFQSWRNGGLERGEDGASLVHSSTAGWWQSWKVNAGLFLPQPGNCLLVCFFNINPLRVFFPSAAFSKVKKKSCLCLNCASCANQPLVADKMARSGETGDHFRDRPLLQPHHLAGEGVSRGSQEAHYSSFCPCWWAVSHPATINTREEINKARGDTDVLPGGRELVRGSC